MIDVTSLLNVWRPEGWQGRCGVSPTSPTCGVWWTKNAALHVSAQLDDRGRWKADLQRDGEHVTSGFGDTIEGAVLAMIEQEAYGRGVERERRQGAAPDTGDARDTICEAPIAHVRGLRPAPAVAAEVRKAVAGFVEEAGRAFGEQFEDALTRRGQETELRLHVQDRYLTVARRMLDEAGYSYEVLTKGGIGQLRDGGTTTPVIINLVAPRGV